MNGFMPGFGFSDGGGFQFHFGIGAFPFGIFTTFNNWGGAVVPPGEFQLTVVNFFFICCGDYLVIDTH